MHGLVAFVRLGRPVFLGGGFLLYALGVAIAAASGHAIDLQRYALGQGAVTAFQLMTHYANDYYDLDADRANLTPTAWSGGSRVLPDGELAPRIALIAALGFAAIGITVSIAVIILARCPLSGPTLAAIAFLAWTYSAPPLRLCARGLGELDTALVVTVLVPWLGFYLQAPELRGAAMLALSVAPLALLQIAMLIAIELPDADGDARTGKRTLVVRIGAVRSARLYVAITALAFIWPAVAFAAAGLPLRVVLAAMTPVPLAVWRMRRIDRDPYERAAMFSVVLLIATTAAELVAWLR